MRTKHQGKQPADSQLSQEEVQVQHGESSVVDFCKYFVIKLAEWKEIVHAWIWCQVALIKVQKV